MQYQTWKRYENPERWTSYQMQIDSLLEFAPSTCLEIGVGNHIVSDALKRLGIKVTTFDVDPTLEPDVVGSVAERLPFDDNAFDVLLCAEVLEHLPFASFTSSLDEIARVSKVGAVISLPHWGYTFRCIADLPGLPKLRHAWKLPFQTQTPKGEHEWEIGRRDYPLARIVGEMSTRFKIRRHFLSVWMPYHHFFLLEKR